MYKNKFLKVHKKVYEQDTQNDCWDKGKSWDNKRVSWGMKDHEIVIFAEWATWIKMFSEEQVERFLPSGVESFVEFPQE